MSTETFTPRLEMDRLGPLLAKLRDRGFPIGVDDCLKAQLVLDQVDPMAWLHGVSDEPDNPQAAEILRLRYSQLLCPIFATNARQQEEFDLLFRDFFCDVNPLSVPSGTYVPPADPEKNFDDTSWVDFEQLEKERKERDARREQARLAAQEEERQRIENLKKERRRALRQRVVRWLNALLLVVVGVLGLLWAVRQDYSHDAGSQLSLDAYQAADGSWPQEDREIHLQPRRGRPNWLAWYLRPRTQWAPTPADVARCALQEKERAQNEGPTWAFRFKPAKEGSTSVRLLFQQRNPFDTVPRELPVALTAHKFDPPEKRLRFEPGGSAVFKGVYTGRKGETRRFVLKRGDGKAFVVPALVLSDTKNFVKTHLAPPRSPGQKVSSYPFTVQFTPAQSSVPGQVKASVAVGGLPPALRPAPLTLSGTILRQQQERFSQPLQLSVLPAGSGFKVNPGHLNQAPTIYYAVLTFVVAMLYLLILRNRRAEKGERVSPYHWPLQTDKPALPYSSSDLRNTVTLLAPFQMSADEIRFDLDATLRLSSRMGGYPQLVFRPHLSVDPDYLALVERASNNDQRADLHVLRLQALHKRGLKVVVFTFSESLNQVWDEHGHVVSLAQLHNRYPRHRLLVFASKSSLQTPTRSGLVQGVNELGRWPLWSWFADAGEEDEFLRYDLSQTFSPQQFAIFPASLAGLRDFAKVAAESSDGAYFTEKGHRDELVTTKLPTFPHPPDRELYNDQEYLRDLEEQYFQHDRRLFLWLCACALYPRPLLELTLATGRIIESHFPWRLSSQYVELGNRAPLVTEENLQLLLQLKWFREGEMPENLRLALQRRLRAHRRVEIDLRAYLVDLLSRTPLPPENSEAGHRHETEKRMQEWLGDPEERAREMRRQLLDIPSYLVSSHPLLVKLLKEKDPNTNLWADNPWLGRLVSKLFHYGLPRLDYLHSRFIPVLPLMLAALIAGAAFSLAPTTDPSSVRYDLHRLDLKASGTQFRFGTLQPGDVLRAQLMVDNQRDEPISVEMRRTWSSNTGTPVRVEVAPRSQVPVVLSLSLNPELIRQLGNTGDPQREMESANLNDPYTTAPIVVTVKPLGKANQDLVATRWFNVSGDKQKVGWYPEKPTVFSTVLNGPAAAAQTVWLRGFDIPKNLQVNFKPDNNVFQAQILSGPSATDRGVVISYRPRSAGSHRASLIFQPSDGSAPVIHLVSGTTTEIKKPRLKYVLKINGAVAREPLVITDGTPDVVGQIERSDGQRITFDPGKLQLIGNSNGNLLSLTPRKGRFVLTKLTDPKVQPGDYDYQLRYPGDSTTDGFTFKITRRAAVVIDPTPDPKAYPSSVTFTALGEEKEVNIRSDDGFEIFRFSFEKSPSDYQVDPNFKLPLTSDPSGDGDIWYPANVRVALKIRPGVNRPKPDGLRIHFKNHTLLVPIYAKIRTGITPKADFKVRRPNPGPTQPPPTQPPPTQPPSTPRPKPQQFQLKIDYVELFADRSLRIHLHVLDSNGKPVNSLLLQGIGKLSNFHITWRDVEEAGSRAGLGIRTLKATVSQFEGDGVMLSIPLKGQRFPPRTALDVSYINRSRIGSSPTPAPELIVKSAQTTFQGPQGRWIVPAEADVFATWDSLSLRIWQAEGPVGVIEHLNYNGEQQRENFKFSRSGNHYLIAWAPLEQRVANKLDIYLSSEKTPVLSIDLREQITFPIEGTTFDFSDDETKVNAIRDGKVVRSWDIPNGTGAVPNPQ